MKHDKIEPSYAVADRLRALAAVDALKVLQACAAAPQAVESLLSLMSETCSYPCEACAGRLDAIVMDLMAVGLLLAVEGGWSTDRDAVAALAAQLTGLARSSIVQFNPEAARGAKV